MKILAQLLKEFWLPLLLGAAWTLFNFYDRPISQWSTRTVLNVFGPTFFFMSWLVAQWYRVRKQQRVEEGIATLNAGVQALHSPLLPCSMFLTLRIEAEDEDLERVFGEHRGFRSYGPGNPTPEPPYGPPPEVEDCRLHSPSGYVDYRNGVVEAAGVTRSEHPGYNTLHRRVDHSVCHLRPKALSESFLGSEPLFCAPLVTLEVYVGGRPKSTKIPPTLVLKSDSKNIPDVVGAAALDNTVIVDHAIHSLVVSPPDATGYSASNLKGAFLRLTADFLFIRGLMSLPKKSWPRLHNFQLWLGGSGRHVLSFSAEDLKGQLTRENPNSIVGGDALNPQIIFECEVEDDMFAKNFMAVA